MREDFHKVVIERPRWGSRMRNRKTHWSTKDYDPGHEYPLPVRESSSWNWNPQRKEFSDRLGPLQRYLDKQVGRPWGKVEGEFRRAMDLGTVIGRHLWDHARRMVETDCRLGVDGRPVTLAGYPVRRLFVHPRTGLLLRAKERRPDEARERRERIEKAESVALEGDVRAEKIRGVWYLLIDEHRFEEAVEFRKDQAGKPVGVRTRRRVIRKKQANRDELRLIRAALEASIPGNEGPSTRTRSLRSRGVESFM